MLERTHISEEALILHYYGEPDADPQVERHLAECAACRAALAQLVDTLSLVEAHRGPEPLAGLERRVWARVEADIATRRAGWLSRLFDLPRRSRAKAGGLPRWAIAGGVAAMVIAAFVAGRVTRPAMNPVASQVAAAPGDPVERVLVLAIGDHLDRSQMVLLELLNADAARVENIAAEQERARDLVAANRLYRQSAAQAGDEGVREVLDALERVLLEIANAPADVSPRDLDALRASIEERGILFRVRVVASEMRQREERVVVPPAPAIGP